MARTEAQRHNWFIERNKIGIVRTTTSNITNLSTFTSPTSVKTVRLHVARNDWDFKASSGSDADKINNEDSPSFDKIYHVALAYYTLAKLFEIRASADEDPEILSFAQLWRAKYEDLVSKAKGTNNQGKIGSDSNYTIVPSDGFLF